VTLIGKRRERRHRRDRIEPNMQNGFLPPRRSAPFLICSSIVQ
jgi:hypothetical protein